MKNGIPIGLTLLLCLVIQTAILPALGVSSIAPDLIFVVLIPAALLWEPVYAALLGAAAGLLIDILFGHGLGLNALFYLGACWLLGKYGRRFFNENALMPAAMAAGAFLLRELFTALVVYLARMEIAVTGSLALRTLASALLTAALTIPFYLLLFSFMNRRERRRSGFFYLGR